MTDVGGKMLKIDDVVKKMGLIKPTLRLWIQNKSIPFVRVGKLIRFESTDLNRWIESRKVVVVQSRS
jgi:excisionase family DNA binding protein